MDFKKLRTFRAAARLLNFSEASAQLGYVQSAVTNQIKALEEELSTQLFERNGRGVTLTYAGEQLLSYADKLFAIRDEAQQAVRGGIEEPQLLRIAGHETIITYRLPTLLNGFVRENPKAQFQVQPISVSQLKSKVLNEEIDVAFILGECFHLAGTEQASFNSEEIAIIAGNDHWLAKKEEVYPSDFTDEPLLLTELGCSYRNQFERALINAGAYTGNKFEFVSIEAIKACVKLGMGVAAISKASVEKELEQGSLKALNWQGDTLSAKIHMIWKKGKVQPSVVRHFIEYCMASLP